MISNDSDFFKVEDFDSIRIDVSVQNQTSKTGVDGGTKSFGDLNMPQDPTMLAIRLIEFRKNGISLEVPKKIAAPGHVLNCTLDISGGKTPFTMNLHGKVTEVQSLGDNRERLDLLLSDYDSVLFQRAQDIFKNRQAEIDKFFAQVKS